MALYVGLLLALIASGASQSLRGPDSPELNEEDAQPVRPVLEEIHARDFLDELLAAVSNTEKVLMDYGFHSGNVGVAIKQVEVYAKVDPYMKELLFKLRDLQNGKGVKLDCSSFSCPQYFILKKLPASIIDQTVSACCDKACSWFECPQNYLLVSNHQEVAGSSAAICCRPACYSFVCPNFYALVGSPLQVAGSTVDACCLQTCITFNCPSNFLLVADPQNKVGQTVDDCCLQACSSFICGPGWISKMNAVNMVGKTRLQCCLQVVPR